jgi:hypothetical protein
VAKRLVGRGIRTEKGYVRRFLRILLDVLEGSQPPANKIKIQILFNSTGANILNPSVND